MAKHIRSNHNSETMGDYWTRWNNYLAEKGLEPEDFEYHTIEQRAVQKVTPNKTVDVVKQEMWNAYNEVRADYDLLELERKSANEQTNLLRNNLLDSFCSVFQKADRILTNLSVDVFLNDEVENHSPAWNDGKNVTFNASQIRELTEDTVTSLHGLNYHELAHLMFTPRVGTALGKWVMERKTVVHENKWKDYQGNEHTSTHEEIQLLDPKRSRAFNILEDCRAEYYLTLKYPSIRPFLVATIGEYLAKTPDDFAENFILLAGRQYFSLAGRQYSFLSYAEKYGLEQAKQVYLICSEYRSLVYPRDYTRGQELIEQLIAIMPDDFDSPSGCGGRPVMRNGKPAGEKEQDTLKGADNEPDGLALGGNGYSETGKKNDNGEFVKETKDFNTDKQAEILESIEQTVQRAKADSTLRQKVSETIKAITKDSSTKSILGKGGGTGDEPTQAEIMASRLFGQELERIRIECDPAWELERPTGKLNVRRAMNADVNEISKLFDRWTIGNDDYDIECCIALDRSGSMYSEIGSASRSAWVIKRAIEKINGRVSVMTFNHESRMLYTADQKASATTALIAYPSGGTDPYYAILESQRIFSQSKAKTKLMFLLTDGAFNDSSNGMIESMNRDGVFTSVVFLGNEEQAKTIMENPEQVSSYSHGAKNFRAIGKPSDLVKVAKDVVKHTIKAGK